MNTAFTAPAFDTACLIVCFSHLRWHFVYQRPQHLMTRAAQSHDVLYFEEPLFETCDAAHLRIVRDPSGVVIATPVLPHGADDPVGLQRVLLDRWLDAAPRGNLVMWYYTPMALAFSDHVASAGCVYDCMDELSAFDFAPHGLHDAEAQLLARADVVFTGGHSLYEAKKSRHRAVFEFPSSIDAEHFSAARTGIADPQDQAAIARPRIGFFGVIDERMDLNLVRRAADELPDVQFVMIGPVVKIDPAALPQGPNLHWLGGRPYHALPAYLGNWDAGWMPFALNRATQFISPTKTPEFLAAGLAVVSTAVPDVVRDYGNAGLVQIASRDDIAVALRTALGTRDPAWHARVDRRLCLMSWDRTWSAMNDLLTGVRPPQAAVPAAWTAPDALEQEA